MKRPARVDAKAYERDCLQRVRDEWPAELENPKHWRGRTFVSAEIRGEYPNTELRVTLHDARHRRNRTFRYEIWELNRIGRNSDEFYDPETFVSFVFTWRWRSRRRHTTANGSTPLLLCAIRRRGLKRGSLLL